MPSHELSAPVNVSAILITKNERHNLPACIATLDFCKEIIVLDNGSTDGTTELAKSLGCRVFETPDWPGYGRQKQRALDLAVSDWVFSIDADERVTQELKAAIVEALSQPSDAAVAGYRLNRRSFFLGHAMRYGGWSPDWIVRLFRRDSGRFDSAVVHESIVVQGQVKTLSGDLLHYSYPSVRHILEKQSRYALLGAQKKSSSGSTSGVLAATLISLVTFARVFFFRLGFLDGRYGFLAAVSRAQETFWKYATTRYLELPSSPNSDSRDLDA